MKRFYYRDTPESLILVFMAIMCWVLSWIWQAEITWGFLIIIVSMTILHHNWNQKANASNHFFWCKRSCLSKRSIWIVQQTTGLKECNDCARYKLVKEMVKLIDNIPKGTICYCCTHEVIKKQIVMKYPNAEVTPVYKKNIKRLKEATRTKACKHCNKDDCKIREKEVSQFYAIKFVK